VYNEISEEQEMIFLRYTFTVYNNLLVSDNSLLQTTISYIVTINAHHNVGKFYNLLIEKCYSIVDHVSYISINDILLRALITR